MNQLEDQLRSSVFKQAIEKERRDNKRKNDFVDSRGFDEDDDFYDRAKVRKRRKKNTPNPKETLEEMKKSVENIKSQMAEITEKLKNTEVSEEQIAKLKSEKSQLKMRLISLGCLPKLEKKLPQTKQRIEIKRVKSSPQLRIQFKI